MSTPLSLLSDTDTVRAQCVPSTGEIPPEQGSSNDHGGWDRMPSVGAHCTGVVLALFFLSTMALTTAQHPTRNKQFRAGEIYVSVGGTDVCTSTAAGIIQIDARSYVPRRLDLGPQFSVQSDWIRYDPFRDRLLVHGSPGLLLIDRNDDISSVASTDGLVLRGASAAGNGMIYLDVNGYLWCLDGNDVLLPVIDARTPQLERLPYFLGGINTDDILYHGATNSIYHLTYASCPSDSSSEVRRLQLSRNGLGVVDMSSQVVGTCGFRAPGLDRGPSSSLLLGTPSASLFVVEHAGGAMNAYTIDAKTLGRQEFASWTGSYRGFDEGAYSEYLGAAIINGGAINAPYQITQLWGFQQGTVGLGTLLYQDNPPISCPFVSVQDIEIIR